MPVALSGFYSGLDTSSIIAQIVAVNQIPINQLNTKIAALTDQSSALNFISSSISSLKTNLQVLSNPDIFRSRAATSSTTSVGSATVANAAALGSVSLNITQVATASTLRGGKAGGLFSDSKTTAPLSGTTSLSSALNTDQEGKFFIINGTSISLSATTVIDDGNPTSANSVIGKINNLVSGVTASYNATTGKFSLSSASPIILGSGADTSSFLREAQLFNNGTGAVTSNIGLGRLNPSATLSTSGLRTTPTSGNFSINGISISYTTSDTLDDVLDKINASDAGVTAVYDRYQDQVVLQASGRGAQGIAVADGTGNLATALRLTSTDSALTIGKATLFTVGQDPTVRQSEDQFLTEDELGIEGVTFNATGTGSTTINITADTTAVKTALDNLVNQYNSTQSLIESYLKIDTSVPSNNGVLASDNSFVFLPKDLRNAFSAIRNESTSITMLEDLGIVGNGTNNTVTTADSAKISSALSDHLDEMIALFTDSSTGLVSRLTSVLDNYNLAGTGAISSRQASITTQKSGLDDEIAILQARSTSETAFLQAQFAALEQYQGQTQNISKYFE